MRSVGKELEQLAFHFATRPAEYASHFECKKKCACSAGQFAHTTDRAVMPAVMLEPATTAQRFLDRRVSGGGGSGTHTLSGPRPDGGRPLWGLQGSRHRALTHRRALAAGFRACEPCSKSGGFSHGGSKARLNPSTFFAPDEPSILYTRQTEASQDLRHPGLSVLPYFAGRRAPCAKTVQKAMR